MKGGEKPIVTNKYIQHDKVWYKQCPTCQRWQRIYPEKMKQQDWTPLFLAVIALCAMILAIAR
jgi:hypothetical protein